MASQRNVGLMPLWNKIHLLVLLHGLYRSQLLGGLIVCSLYAWQEVRQMLVEAHERALDLLKENRAMLQTVSHGHLHDWLCVVQFMHLSFVWSVMKIQSQFSRHCRSRHVVHFDCIQVHRPFWGIVLIL